MIWATVSAQSCFCWLYRASPSLAVKNIINLISVLLVMSMCRVFSCVVGRGCLLWPVCSLCKILLAFALLHPVLQGQTRLLLQVSLNFLLLHSRTCENESCSVMSDSLQPHGLYSPWNSPGQNTGVGSLSLQQICPTQESNQGLPHYRRILYQLSYEGSCG